jgi:hypothetical protein
MALILLDRKAEFLPFIFQSTAQRHVLQNMDLYLKEGANRAVHAVHTVHQGTCVWPHP